MNDAPLFSILVPVYNVAPYLRECIDSVLAQSCPDFELLLVDDGSADESGAICDEYAAKDPRIRVFHKENGGQVSARCYAVGRAVGAYYVFLDSDDSLVPHMLETLRGAIGSSGADCVIYGYLGYSADSGRIPVTIPEMFCGKLYTDKRTVLNLILNNDSYNALWRKCVKSSCFDGRDYSPFYHIRRGEDLLQSLEILENAASFYFLHDTLYVYRRNEGSVTHTICYDGYRADDTINREVLDLLSRLDVFLDEDYARLRNHMLDALVMELKRICRYCSDRANRRSALQSCRESAFFRSFLSVGYRHVPSDAQSAPSRIRRFFNRCCVFLLRHGCFECLHLLCTRIYKAG